MHVKRIVVILFLIFLMSPVGSLAQRPRWFIAYSNGLKAMKRQNWQAAVKNFQTALRFKNVDNNKLRAFGTVFIEYYPHRELGICYLHLGRGELARRELTTSMQQSPSKRARKFLQRIGTEEIPPPPSNVRQEEAPPPFQAEKPESTPAKKSVPHVGERLSIAVLPFVSRGFAGEMGDMDLLDKLITGFVNLGRFKVIERAQLEKIIEEQKLGMTGIVDASTAAEVGKGIGVDAVVVGSVTRAKNSVSIDARLIDTETATIISAKDAYSNRLNLQDISNMVNELAVKIKNDLPIVTGYIINIDGEKLILDLGSKSGVKKGMKATIYREGESIIHPVTKQVVGKVINELCEIQITEVYESYSIARITKQKGELPKKLDKVITK